MFLRAAIRSLRRSLATTPAEAVKETLLEPTATPPSRIRAVFFGFLTGVTFSAAAGYVYLTEDINASSREVQRSVASLSHDVTAISKSLDRLNQLERAFTKLQDESAKASELAQIRDEVRVEKDALELSLSKHKTSVWEAQEEMYKAINRLQK